MRYLNGRDGDLGDFVAGSTSYDYADAAALTTGKDPSTFDGSLGLVGTDAADAALYRSDGTSWQAVTPYQTAANFAAIDPADYVDGVIIVAEDTGVLWRIITSTVDSSQRAAVRAMIGGQWVDWSRFDVFNGSGTEVPSDQGFAAETETNGGTVTATDGTVTHATAASGDEADVDTAAVEAESTDWLGCDVGDLQLTVAGSTANNAAQFQLWLRTSATNHVWVRLHSVGDTTWNVAPRNGTSVDTGLAVADARDLEFFYNVSTQQALVYQGRAAQPTMDTTLDVPVDSAGSGLPYLRVALDQGSAGSAALDYTRLIGMRATS